MKLIDLLVQELPKRGGWPEGGCAAIYDAVYEGVLFTSGGAPAFISEASGWTVAVLGNGATWMLGKGVPIRYLPQDWHESIITREQYEAALAASRQPAWSGEGLPPVGCECEAKYLHATNAEWFSFRCVAVDCEVAFGWGGKEPTNLTLKDFEFRPIQAEAERKRIEIAQQLCDTFGNGIKVDEKEGFGKTWLNLYDAIAAGKIPGVKLAD